MANKLTTIDFSQENIYVAGDADITVKRTRTFYSGTNVEIYLGTRLILATSVNTLVPFSKISILRQDLEDTVSLTYNDKVFEWENNWLKIRHNWLDFVSKRLCTVYFNNKKMLDVYRKGLALSLDTNGIDSKTALYLTLFLLIRYCELDGAD